MSETLAYLPSSQQVLPRGLAARCGLRVGDRILAVNGQDVREATHQEAVSALLRPCLELSLLVRRDPPPPGMRELCIQKAPGEKLGISIRGGAKGHAGNPCDPTDEGIFISKVRAWPCWRAGKCQTLLCLILLCPQVSPTGAAGRDGRLHVGLRLLEVNQQSLLGLTHAEAVQLLRSVGDTLTVLVCDGFDTSATTGLEVSGLPGPRCCPGVMGWVASLSPQFRQHSATLHQLCHVGFFLSPVLVLSGGSGTHIVCPQRSRQVQHLTLQNA